VFALVVDDSKVTRLLVAHILRQVGFEVAQAANGREGIDQLLWCKPRVVLIDWNMPDMNGLEFVRAVRADANVADVRLLMVTSEEDQRLIAEALEAGADGYIHKPFTKEVILEKLQLLGITPR
jgi:two-component system, chemotaxis family, chemotaxis protein CheY